MDEWRGPDFQRLKRTTEPSLGPARKPGRGRLGCGCLLLICLLLGSCAFVFSQLSQLRLDLGCDGCPPTPQPFVEGRFTAEAVLDPSHPIAVQRFEVSQQGQSPRRYSGTVYATTYNFDFDAGFRLTVLAEDGQSTAFESPAPRGSRLDLTALEPGGYMALVELPEGARPEGVSVWLTVDVSAEFDDAQWTEDRHAPAGFQMKLTPVGGFGASAVAVLESSHRETVAAGQDTERRLWLLTDGEARPSMAGGKGHLVISIRPETYHAPVPGLQVRAVGSVSPPALPFFWALDYKTEGNPYFNQLVGAGLVAGCSSPVDCGKIEVLVRLRVDVDRLYVDESGAPATEASYSPGDATLTYVVEVRDYILDVPALPGDATLTLEPE